MQTTALQAPVNQETVKGIVLKEDGQPLERVNIMSTGNPGNASSVTTSKDGRYQIVKEEPFVVVEEMPMYPGGEGELLKFIAENTQYPEAAKAQKIEGKVVVRFIVNTEGDTEGMSVLKGVHPLLDAEAIRVVGMLSGFRPGMQGGKAVPVWYMVPINFALPITNQP
jgi:TonB family protein